MLGGGWGRFGGDWFGVGHTMRVIALAEGCRHGLMSKTVECVKWLRAQTIRGRPLLKNLKSTFATTLQQRFSQLKFDGLK